MDVCCLVCVLYGVLVLFDMLCLFMWAHVLFVYALFVHGVLHFFVFMWLAQISERLRFFVSRLRFWGWDLAAVLCIVLSRDHGLLFLGISEDWGR